MASLGLSLDEVKSIEQVRQRLSQLSNSIQSLKTDMVNSPVLPHPTSLQASMQILNQNLESLQVILNENTELFQRLAMHPSSNYPARAPEAILWQLLRKKPEPNIEEWAKEGREIVEEVTPAGIERLENVWADVREWMHERVKTYILEESGDVYTAEEREMGVENVRTGLRKNLEEESEEEDEEDEDEEMETQPPKAAQATVAEKPKGPEPELLFWFGEVGDGNMPSNVELESKRIKSNLGIPGV